MRLIHRLIVRWRAFQRRRAIRAEMREIMRQRRVWGDIAVTRGEIENAERN